MKLILSLFKIGATILFYFLTVITVIVFVRFGMNLIETKADSYITINDDNMQSVFKDFTGKETGQAIYSPDRQARFRQIPPAYSVDVQPNSAVGLYYMASTIVFMTLGILILLMFRRIFGEISMDAPFRASVVRHLQILASLFIVSEVLGFIHYYILDMLINNSLQLLELHQISTKGSSLFIGLIILIIAVVYKRGLEIYEENSLTV